MIRKHNRAAIAGPSPPRDVDHRSPTVGQPAIDALHSGVSATFVAAALGHVLVAMIIGLITGAFFAGMAS